MVCPCCQQWYCFDDNPCVRKGIRARWSTLTNAMPAASRRCDLMSSVYGGTVVFANVAQLPQDCAQFLGGGGEPRYVREELLLGTGQSNFGISDGPICCRRSRDDWEITGFILMRLIFGGFSYPSGAARYSFVATPAGVTVTLAWLSKPTLTDAFGNEATLTACGSFWQPYINRLDTAPTVEIYDSAPTIYSCEAAGQKTGYIGYPNTLQNRISILPVSGPHANTAACEAACTNPLP